MSHSSQSEIIRILVQPQEGEIHRPEAADRAFEAPYAERRRLAANFMHGERPAHTLRLTAQEACLDELLTGLAGRDGRMAKVWFMRALAEGGW